MLTQPSECTPAAALTRCVEYNTHPLPVDCTQPKALANKNTVHGKKKCIRNTNDMKQQNNVKKKKE